MRLLHVLILEIFLLIFIFILRVDANPQCDINITWSSNTTYTMDQNNTYYCLNQNWYFEGVTAINTTSNLENSTLNCLGYNIDSNDGSKNGIDLVSGSKNNFIRNCNVTDFNYGIYVSDSPNNTLINNTANSNFNAGFNIDSNNTTLINNTANSNYYYGIFVSDYNNNLTNNTASYNSYSLAVGIYLSGANHYLNHNTIIDNGRGIHSRSSYTTLINNTANSNTLDGILIDLTNNNTLINNTATSNYCGISISLSSNNTILNNNASDQISNGYGISLQSSSNNNITNNIANNNEYYGIYLTSSSNNNIINNTANTNTFGIGTLSGSNNNTITNNTLNSSGGYGVQIISSYNNSFSGGSIKAATFASADYFIRTSGATNNFTNTNFTTSRRILLYVTTDWFNYKNDSTSNIWLKNNVSVSQATITRNLIYWNQELMQWNDSSDLIATANYNLTGLLPNTAYEIYNNSILVYTLQTDSSGNLPSFTIYLDSMHEIKVQAAKADGSSCSSNNECLNNYCVHNVCRSTSFYCGDIYCDAGESCASCSRDCGVCTTETQTPSTPSGQVNIPPPVNPTEFPPTVIELPQLKIETPITMPSSGITVRLEPNFVLTVYPLTNTTAVVHNLSKIEEPGKYKILLCNQTLISSYEINITADLTYYCANYSGYPIDEPTINIFKFKNKEWIPLITGNLIRNNTKKVVCGKIESTPYMITGFNPTVTSETAMITINDVNNTIILARKQNINVTEATVLMNKALYEYYSCNYMTAKALADKALDSLVKVKIAEWVLYVAFVLIMIIGLWYYKIVRSLKHQI